LDNTKQCTCCKQVKKYSEYYSNKQTKDKLASFCKKCSYKAFRKSLMKVYYQEDKVNRRKEVQKKYREENKEKIKMKVRESRYSLLNDEYTKILISQNYSCFICHKHQDECQYGLDVDHNHSTGKVRGLLCGNCNKSLGLFKDNINYLKNAIKYLENAANFNYSQEY
jgi:hypothetical protein